jgi:hypothetical protein
MRRAVQPWARKGEAKRIIHGITSLSLSRVYIYQTYASRQLYIYNIILILLFYKKIMTMSVGKKKEIYMKGYNKQSFVSAMI